MTTTQNILQFHFSPTTLKHSALKIIPTKLNTLNELNIDKLYKIRDAIGVKSFSFAGKNLIPQVYRKFKNSINNSKINLERSELRTLTYSLTYSEQNLKTIFSTEVELKIALEIMEENWRDSFLLGLIDCLLSNWETNYRKSLELLEHFITKKLDNYTGNRTTLISFKNNKRYFNSKNGDLILGDTIAKLKKSIKEATKILGVPESWFSYSYFSRVIVTYFEKNKANIINEIDNLHEVLLKNNNIITSKRLISKLIIHVNQPEFASLQDKVKKISFNQIGDPNNKSNWTAFENASENEKNDIIKGRNILNEWITRQFINVFFNICINDDRRKQFWLKYVKSITSFKVYGPSSTKSTLKSDERIAEYIDARFETVYSNRDVSAFILYIGDYTIIEFSNEGYACCAYKNNSSNRPPLNKRLNSVDDLRNSSLPLAIQSDSNYYYISDEGRLFHNSNWESKFNHWLKDKVLV
jgi:hypothetical protein